MASDCPGSIELDFDTELKPTAESHDMEMTQELPDGNIITVGHNHLRYPEVHSQPKLRGVEASGIHVMSLLSTMVCDVGICKDLFANVVLHRYVPRGRRTHDRGVDCVSTASDVSKVVSPPVRKCSVRIGRSILSSLGTFQQMCTSKAKNDESDLPRAHNANHARDVQRARHVRGDPGCFVAVRFWTHARHRERTSCVARESFFETQGLPRALDADHVRDVQRARHVRGDPGCYVPVWLKMHTRIRDALF